jgi:predicted ATPase
LLTRLRLERFKNFQDADLQLGPFTVLVGTNASGKSNLRDAFRFLHGISRGYTLAEIIGEKWVEGGVLQWRGIRGGTREVTYRGAETFALEASFMIMEDDRERLATYRIEVSKGDISTPPRVVRERLAVEGRGQYVFDSHPNGAPAAPPGALHLPVVLRKEPRKGFVGPTINFSNNQPVLTQILSHPEVKLPTVRELVKLALGAIGSMRFLDLAPDAMRMPSLPGQNILGDRGENLSSVLQAICKDENRKQALVQWVQRLTPLDASDFEFVPDAAGRILVHLVEANGQKTSAYSASDGTLRFLAMIAALLGPEPARFYFFEELENGIHPTRLHLLLQLIEQKVSRGAIQMVASSHSPQLLGFLSQAARADASLVYRLPEQPHAQICRILDIPEAARLLEKGEFGTLHASGWLEDAMFFLQGEEGAE